MRFFVTLLLFITCSLNLWAQDPPDAIQWDMLPPLPDSLGFGGAMAGTHEDALIVIGGSNFPFAPPWENGEKVWYDKVFVLVSSDGDWKTFSFPQKIAYGTAISTPEGVIVLGGDDGKQVFDKVWLVSWNSQKKEVTYKSFPKLPRPTTFHSASFFENKLYVIAGQKTLDSTLHTKEFWVLDLEEQSNGWQSLPVWEGKPRIKAQSAIQSDGKGGVHLYLIGGEYAYYDSTQTIQREYLSEVQRFNLDTQIWETVTPLPNPLAAGIAIEVGKTQLLTFGGTTGEWVGKVPIQEHPPFPNEIWSFHTITQTWTQVGSIPQSVVTMGIARWNEKWVIPSGEIKPGIRTNKVQVASLTNETPQFGWINYMVLWLYLGALLLIGFYASKHNKTSEDFFLANRKMPWWAAGLSIYATQLSAITFISTPAVAYSGNWLIFPISFTIFFFVPIVIKFYLPFFRRLNIRTAYAYLEHRFDVSVRLLGSFSFILFQLVRMAIVIYLPALALTAITGLNIYWCIFLTGSLAMIYTILGGIEAVIWTDVLQVIILLGGVLFSMLLILIDQGGLEPIIDSANRLDKFELFNFNFSLTETTTWAIILGGFFLQIGPYTTDQAVVQRYLTTENESKAAKSIWLNGILSVPSVFLFFALGTGLFVFFRSHPELLQLGMENDQVFPLFIAHQLPIGIAGLVVAGVFAASMSTLDSSLHSIATTFTTDVLVRFGKLRDDRHQLSTARWIVLIMGIVATSVGMLLATFDIQSLFILFQAVLGLLSSGVAGVFILGIFTHRVSAKAAWIGALLSAILLFYISQYTTINTFWFALIGISSCVMLGYFASFVLPNDQSTDGYTFRTLREKI